MLHNSSSNDSDPLLAAAAADAADSSKEELYELPPFAVALLSCFYGIISLTAFVGNSLVIYVVVVSPRMRTVTNYYIANLAFADVTIALFAIPFQFHAALWQRWDLPEFMCQFCPTVQIFSVNISIFTLVAISMDRYRAIMYPLRRKPPKSLCKVIIVLIWILSMAFALPMGILHTFDYVDDNSQPVPEGEEKVKKPFCYIELGNATNSTVTAFRYYSVSLVTVEYFVPLTVITVAYARIAFRLWGTKTPGAAQDDRDHNILVNKKKVIKMLVIVVLIFAFCWLPWQSYMAAALVSPRINDYRYINIIFFVSHWLAMSNSCYNPFIYGVYSEKFRREFSARLPCLRNVLGSPERADLAKSCGTTAPVNGTTGNGGTHLTSAGGSSQQPHSASAAATTDTELQILTTVARRQQHKMRMGKCALHNSNACSCAMKLSPATDCCTDYTVDDSSDETDYLRPQQQQQQMASDTDKFVVLDSEI